jgi:23S rRNA (uracil1939-C5)-methyltransferase
LTNQVEVTLQNAAYGGDMIGRLPDGRAVFVPFGVPGETVRLTITQDKKNFARGEIVEVPEPSPYRIPAPCAHFSECGGCHYQHISYDQQLQLKKTILQEQLERIGRLEAPPVAEVIPSTNQLSYRNHIKFHISPEGKPGFIRANKRGVMPIVECRLPETLLAEIWPLLEIEPGSGISSLGLRLGIEDDILVVLESQHPFDAQFDIESIPLSVVHISPENSIVLAGSDYSIMQVKERQFRVSGQSFFQVNSPLAEKLVEKIVSYLPEISNLALELYSGVGLFSAFIAQRAEKLITVEASESACDDFVHNLDDFNNVDLYQGPVEDILPNLDITPEIVLLDPPRTGLHKEVIRTLSAMQPKLLFYISCDPATLARDSRLLIEGGFAPQQFIPFDFFPQTYHIETLSIWVR